MNKEAYCQNIAGEGCGLKKVLNIVGGKWKPLILCLIWDRGACRYNELRKEIFGITNTMLSQSLKEMGADGLVIRNAYAEEVPIRVEYSLTEKARTLVPILMNLKEWGERNL